MVKWYAWWPRQAPDNLFERKCCRQGKYDGEDFLAQNILVKCPSNMKQKSIR